MAALPAAAIAANDTQAARDVDLADDIACLRAILQWPELDSTFPRRLNCSRRYSAGRS